MSEDTQQKASDASGMAGPDVYLDVPVLKVDEIDLECEDLRAHIDVHAEVLDLLKLNVGADVYIGRVNLAIKGVDAQALLKVRLDNVAAIIERVLKTIDENPQILEQITRGVSSAVNNVSEGAGEAVGEVGKGVGDTVNQAGEAVGKTGEAVGKSAGGAVEKAGDAAQATAGKAGDAARETVGSSGQKWGLADAENESGQREEERGDEAQGGAAHQRPDISFNTTVHASSLRFEEVPSVEVNFVEGPGHTSHSGSDRVNLPDRVEKHTDYEGVRVRYVLATRLEAPQENDGRDDSASAEAEADAPDEARPGPAPGGRGS